jgi:predicted ribosomally synthesized peptide with SipW-like signal peptide
MKNKLRFISLASIFAALALGGAVLAWFSDTAAPVSNVFNAGTVEITLNTCK